jgi:uncharacterized C2H2 Zn-finger protein
MGLCLKCATEVGELRERPSLQAMCPKCARVFYNDWERIQHVVNQRHNYIAAGALLEERRAREAVS